MQEQKREMYLALLNKKRQTCTTNVNDKTTNFGSKSIFSLSQSNLKKIMILFKYRQSILLLFTNLQKTTEKERYLENMGKNY